MSKEFQTSLKNNIQSKFCQLFFLLKASDGFEIKKVDLEDGDSQDDFHDMFYKFLDEKIISNDDLSIKLLSDSNIDINAIYNYDYDEYPKELSLVKSFNLKEALKLDFFDFTKDDLKNLVAFIIYMGDNSKGVILFKQHYNISLIKRDNFLLGVKKDNKRFTKMNDSDILKINENVDIINLNGDIYVINLNVLEKQLGFKELLKNRAQKVVSKIKTLNIIEDDKSLDDFADDISLTRKLCKIKDDSKVLELSSDVILNFIKNNSHLKSKFKINDENKIILKFKKDKVNFLELLNDDFLYSSLTKTNYKASNKDKL